MVIIPPPIDTKAPTEELPPSGPYFPPGTRLVGGRFEIIDCLGSGGMGAVYKARDLKLKKQVALKFRLVRHEESPQEAEWKRGLFRDEAAKAQAITHSQVCRIYDVHEAEGYEVISMEFIDGEDLARLLRRIGRLTPKRALELGCEICDGLTAIHAQGLFHQDLKPGNVMIDGEGRAKITDLGLTGRRFQGGTPQYAAPEQQTRQRVSIQSDLYCLGQVLYEMLTGERAFANSSLLDPPPQPLRKLVPEIDAEVDQMVLRCLRADPKERPSSASEVAEALAAALSRMASGSGGNASNKIGKQWTRLASWIAGLMMLSAKRGGHGE